MKILEKIQINGLEVKNRIFMSPMCQYSSDESGLPNDWHLIHWGSRAVGGVGLVMTEVVAVDKGGRITEKDLYLSSRSQVSSFRKVIKTVKDLGAAFGMQIGHAGRKAWSRDKGFHKIYPLISSDSIAFDDNWCVPKKLTSSDISKIVESFKITANLAVECGVDLLEIHAGHGYLINQFLSPISNHRDDLYGGDIENRSRILFEVISAVRDTIPKEMPLAVRLSCADWDPSGFSDNDLRFVAKKMKHFDVDLLDCSAGGTLPITKPTLFEGYQLGFSNFVKSESGILTAGVGLLKNLEKCNEFIEAGNCDVVMIGRELLKNPYLLLHYASKLGYSKLIPWQYSRGYD